MPHAALYKKAGLPEPPDCIGMRKTKPATELDNFSRAFAEFQVAESPELNHKPKTGKEQKMPGNGRFYRRNDARLYDMRSSMDPVFKASHPQQPSTWDIFLSYTRRDLAVAREFADYLCRQGNDVYFDDWDDNVEGDTPVWWITSGKNSKSPDSWQCCSQRTANYRGGFHWKSAFPWKRKIHAITSPPTVREQSQSLRTFRGSDRCQTCADNRTAPLCLRFTSGAIRTIQDRSNSASCHNAPHRPHAPPDLRPRRLH